MKQKVKRSIIMQAIATAHDRMESPIHKKVFVRRIPEGIDGKL